MNELPFSPKLIIWTGIICLGIVCVLFLFSYFQSDTKLVFCDVGQGDGAYIRIHNKIDMIIDAGSEREMLHCLGRHMPFYDRTIEIVAISHPQKDHCGGLEHILEHYTIQHVLAPPVDNKAQFFQRIKAHIPPEIIDTPVAGDRLRVEDAKIEFFWPTHAFIKQHVQFDTQNQRIFGKTSVDLNDFSLIFSIDVDGERILFTGDAYPHILDQVNIKKQISILKVPHHGSNNGVTKKLLMDTRPDISVISVGKKNKYGHPSPEVLRLFEEMRMKYLRTDEESDVVFSVGL